MRSVLVSCLLSIIFDSALNADGLGSYYLLRRAARVMSSHPHSPNATEIPVDFDPFSKLGVSPSSPLILLYDL